MIVEIWIRVDCTGFPNSLLISVVADEGHNHAGAKSRMGQPITQDKKRIYMSQQFSIEKYLTFLGDELISAFAQGGLAPTPGIKGESREKAVRDKLIQLLPSGIGVGSGFVIDTQGNTSRQIDIVLYEDSICPVFRLNESSEASFYPCEGVFAVGEVKSTIGTRETEDIIEKVASVRRLKRFIRPDPQGVTFRPYSSRMSLGISGKSYAQDSDGKHQIWGFGIAHNTTLAPQSIAKKLVESCEKTGRIYAPNLITTTEGLVVKPVKNKGRAREVAWSAIEATGYMTTTLPNPLASLIRDLNKAFKGGFTAPEEAFEEYAPIPGNFALQTYHPFSTAL